MSVFRRGLALAALALAAVASPAPAHQGSPDYLSQVRSIAPALKGLSVEVLNRDDRLEIRNDSGRTVVIEGYNDDPYVRLRGDGRVEVNTSSQAYYVNEDRFANAPVPQRVKDGLAPRWKPVSQTGRFEWHDHRMHYMGKGRPSKIKAPSVRQTVFDWAVPMEVGGTPTAITGTLFWTPVESSGLPLGAIFAFAGLVIVLSVAVVIVRRRRAATGARQAEAW